MIYKLLGNLFAVLRISINFQIFKIKNSEDIVNVYLVTLHDLDSRLQTNSQFIQVLYTHLNFKSKNKLCSFNKVLQLYL